MKRKIPLRCLIFFFLMISLSCSQKLAREVDVGEAIIGCKDFEYGDWKTSPYVLPFPVGKSYNVVLSHCSSSYHSAGSPDELAIDFEMSIGTPITASREGTVVHVEESGLDGSFPNNLVVIKHKDNTYAQYMHLTKNGSLVKKGDTVLQGQEIALSGNTGLAGYPHLHFIVTVKNFSYPYEGVPINFRNTTANERSLASYSKYEAFPYTPNTSKAY